MHKYIYIFFALIVNTYAQGEPASPHEKVFANEPTPFIGITSVDDFSATFEEPNAQQGGAMEMQRYFSTTVISKLSNCVNTVDKVFNNWITANTLIPTQHVKKDNKLTIRTWDKEKKGLFEAVYVLSMEPAYVRASLDYYQLNGQKLALETIESMINMYQLATLWGELAEALECD